jgi:hypothetical protein
MVLVDPAYREEHLRSRAPADQWAQRVRALAPYTTRMSDAQQRELEALAQSGEQAYAGAPLKEMPVVLLSATKANPAFPLSELEIRVKLEDHRALLRRAMGTRASAMGAHQQVPTTRHYIHREEPAAVIAAVTQMVARSRRALPDARD